ncbi:MAG TPA: S9 family peptidase [Actinomycetota bacterium]|jgi:dipeptidyl aminopeptidase/acylaminoacyl peptidase
MDRDLRETPLYKEVERYYRRAMEPGFGRITGATDPAVSPDGRTVAFTGIRLDKLEGTPETRICLASVEGDAGLRQVTNGPNEDAGARWSPDGTRLAFHSDRVQKGRSQAFLLEAGSLSEAAPLPEVPGSVEYLAWSPDGRHLLLGAAGLGADQAGASGSGSVRPDEAERPAWMPDVESSGEDDSAWRRLWLLDLKDGTVRTLSRGGLNVWEAAWCGDDAVAAIVSESPGEEAWYAGPLAVIDVATGRERIVLRSDVQLGLPTPSPDGSRIAVVEALASDRLILAGDLVLVDPAGGEPRRVETPGVDVTSFAWRGADRLLCMGLRGLETVALEVDATTARSEEAWSTNEASGDWFPAGLPIGDGTAFATVLHSASRPPEVVIVEDGKPRTIASTEHDGTRFLRGLHPAREVVTWTAPDGVEIEGLLSTPSTEAPYPLIVVVHGGPVWSYQDAWPRGSLPLLVDRGFAVLLPNPRGSTGRGRKFAEMVVGDMGGGDALDVLAAIDALVARGIADPDRIGVTGGSYGGFMSCWLPTRDTRFKASVAISPVTDWHSQHFNSNIGHWDADFLRDRPESPGGEYHARSPVFFADRVKTPTLLTAGIQDKCTPPGQAVEFYRALRASGVEAEVTLYPQEGHGVRNFPAAIDLTTRMLAWFERFMPPDAK